MISKLGQLEVRCDAPPYGIVRACGQCSIRSPLDVRWCRLGSPLTQGKQSKPRLGARWWLRLFGQRKQTQPTCICGERLPDIKKIGFSFLSLTLRHYLLGQCARCRTVYWDEASLIPDRMDDGVIALTDSLEM